MGKKMDAETFAMLWQGAESLADVAKLTGYSESYASQKAAGLRRGRAPWLKKFRSDEAEQIKEPSPSEAQSYVRARRLDIKEGRQIVSAVSDDQDDWS